MYYARAVTFGPDNPHWQRETIHNTLFLKMIQNHMNEMLQIRGHVLLNDVYDALGVQRTRSGAVLGWFKESKQNYVNIEVVQLPDGNLRIEFETDGNILDYLPEDEDAAVSR